MNDAYPGSATRQDEWKQKCISLARALDARTKKWRQQDAQLREAFLRLCQQLSQHLPHTKRALAALSTAIHHSEFDQLEQHIAEFASALNSQPWGQSDSAEHEALMIQLKSLIKASPVAPQQQTQWLERLGDFQQLDKVMIELIQQLIRPSLALHQLAEPVRQHLLQIVEKIDANFRQPTANQGQLRQQLNSPWDWQALPELLEQMALYAKDAQQHSQQQHKKLEKIIQGISAELDLIESVARDNHGDVAQARDHRQQLQENMVQEVSNMERDLAESQDLDSAKCSLSARLGSIRTHMAQFAEQDEQRLALTEARNKSLEQQLKQLEAETQSLRGELNSTYQQLMRDQLTGVANRLAYEEYLDQFDWAAKAEGEDLCYALWDIDYFKSINDTYGHKAGDRVLQLVAQQIRQSLPEEYFFARIGGEEFVTLMPNTRAEVAMAHCNHLRESIANSGFNYKGKAVGISLSAGVAIRHAEDDRDSLYIRADHALYEAKRAGRNRCVLSEPVCE